MFWTIFLNSINFDRNLIIKDPKKSRVTSFINIDQLFALWSAILYFLKKYQNYHQLSSTSIKLISACQPTILDPLFSISDF